MFSTIAYSESIDLEGARGNVAAVPDQHVKTSGDLIYVPEFNHLLGGIAFIGTNAEEARFVSPSLRRTNPYYIVPVRAALEGAGDDDVSISPRIDIPLDIGEGLEAQAIANPAAAEQIAVLAFLGNAAIQPVAGQIITVHFTITLALTAGTWSFSEITFDDELPIGRYQVVGAHFVIDNATCARFVPVGASHRPGCPTVDADSDTTLTTFRNGSMGLWFEFNQQQPPGVEVLGNQVVASASYDAYMDVIRVG